MCELEEVAAFGEVARGLPGERLNAGIVPFFASLCFIWSFCCVRDG